jgi:hypothetical protein
MNLASRFLNERNKLKVGFFTACPFHSWQLKKRSFFSWTNKMRGRNVIHETNGEIEIKVKIKVQDWDWIGLMEEEGFDDSLGFNKISEL